MIWAIIFDKEISFEDEKMIYLMDFSGLNLKRPVTNFRILQRTAFLERIIYHSADVSKTKEQYQSHNTNSTFFFRIHVGSQYTHIHKSSWKSNTTVKVRWKCWRLIFDKNVLVSAHTRTTESQRIRNLFPRMVEAYQYSLKNGFANDTSIHLRCCIFDLFLSHNKMKRKVFPSTYVNRMTNHSINHTFEEIAMLVFYIYVK